MRAIVDDLETKLKEGSLEHTPEALLHGLRRQLDAMPESDKPAEQKKPTVLDKAHKAARRVSTMVMSRQAPDSLRVENCTSRCSTPEAE